MLTAFASLLYRISSIISTNLELIRMYYHADRVTLYTLLTVAAHAKPLRWTRSQAPEPTPTSSTLIPWNGQAKAPGAFVLARLNLDFINHTCTRFRQTLTTATEVILELEKSKLGGSQPNQKKRYGYSLLKLETELRDTLYYMHDLVLCSGRGGELWAEFVKFRDQVSAAWSLLRLHGVSKSSQFPDREPPARVPQRDTMTNTSGNSIMDLMHSSRPHFNLKRQPRALFLVGAGLGLLGGVVATKIFGSDTTAEINKLNKNLGKNSKLLKITNERVDMLSQNVSRSHGTRPIRTSLNFGVL